MKHLEITGLDNPKELNDWMSKNIQYDHDNTYIGPLVYTTPGTSIKDFCTKNVK